MIHSHHLAARHAHEEIERLQNPVLEIGWPAPERIEGEGPGSRAISSEDWNYSLSNARRRLVWTRLTGISVCRLSSILSW